VTGPAWRAVVIVVHGAAAAEAGLHTTAATSAVRMSFLSGPGYRVCGKPRSTLDLAGSGQREVTTFVRV
jgi:hypothetical protein